MAQAVPMKIVQKFKCQIKWKPLLFASRLLVLFVCFFREEENARRRRAMLILHKSMQVFLRTREK